MTNPPKLPIKELKSLYWAEVHMDEARKCCLHVMSINGLDAESRLAHCLMTGIVVSYARSFGGNQGLPPLSEKYQKFADGRMQALHDDMMENRNKMHAHKDTIHEKKYYHELGSLDAVDRVENVRIIIADNETHSATWSVTRRVQHIVDVPRIAALCDFQMKRINKDSANMLLRFCKMRDYEPGEYILGVDFPKELLG